MKLISKALILLCCCALPVSARELTNEEKISAMDPVSIIRLIAVPNEFDGKWVSVQGLLKNEYEGSRLYLSKEHAELGILANAVYVSYDRKKLDFSPKKISTVQQVGDKYVLLYGRFVAKERRLRDVTRIHLIH